jgi:hypothetical protein
MPLDRVQGQPFDGLADEADGPARAFNRGLNHRLSVATVFITAGLTECQVEDVLLGPSRAHRGIKLQRELRWEEPTP